MPILGTGEFYDNMFKFNKKFLFKVRSIVVLLYLFVDYLTTMSVVQTIASNDRMIND